MFSERRGIMLIYLALAFLLGVLVTVAWIFRISAGTLKVYIPDQDETPYLCAELSKPVGWVCGKKYVMFEVDVRNINSQE